MTALIVADDDRLAQSLQALIQATPFVAWSRISRDRTTIRQDLVEQRPAIVLLALDAGLAEAVSAVKAACPEAVCVTLAADQAGQQAASAAGAELAFVRGYPAPQLYQAILAVRRTS